MSTPEQSLEDTEGILRRWFDGRTGLREYIQRGWAAMQGREPEDSDRDDDLRDMVKAFGRMADRLDRLQAPQPGPGSIIGNHKIVAILLSINIALTGAVSSWVVSTIMKQGESLNDQGKDIAVIKCQLNPLCRVVVSSDRPP